MGKQTFIFAIFGGQITNTALAFGASVRPTKSARKFLAKVLKLCNNQYIWARLLAHFQSLHLQFNQAVLVF